ncbi:MAG: 1-deoxy-D-xylulose-5-phosphate synthase, partial [Spirochaetae bacterium HGW-Spirochaetae-10]
AGPLAVRFPKGDATVAELNGPLPDVTDTKPERIGEGTDLAIVSIGVMKEAALALQAELKERHGINASVIAIRWVRPIDLAALNDMLRRVDAFVFVEDSYRFASGAMCLLEQLDSDAKGRHIQTFAFPDVPIEHGTRGEIFHHYGISVEAMREFLVRHPKMKRESGKVSGRAISL